MPTSKKHPTTTPTTANVKATKEKTAKTTIAKTAPASPSSAPSPSSSRPTLGIGSLIVGAVLVGGVIGAFIFSPEPETENSLLSANETDAQMEAYIRANPELILTVLQDYSISREEENLRQAINLVKANDGKTVFGNPNGDVTIYEFADYNCGYCKRSFVDLMEIVREDGNVRVVVKEMPILAQSSLDAARLSIAAAELGKYEEVHTALMQWHGQINDDVLTDVAASLDLDQAKLEALIKDEAIQDIITANREVAEVLRINGTPAFVIGNEFAPGALPKDQLIDLIAKARAENS
jgi:protein-disulfide isomerase